MGQSEVWSVFKPAAPAVGGVLAAEGARPGPIRSCPGAAADPDRQSEVGSGPLAATAVGGALALGFGSLVRLMEAHLAPGASFPASRRVEHDVILVSYVREGTVAYQDAEGRSGVVLAGEFQVLTVLSGGRYRHRNASRGAWVTAYQVALRPSREGGLSESSEVRRFSAAERRGALCVIASADGRRASMAIPEDALVHSAMLAPGQHVVYELLAGRGAWLHLVRGSVRLGDTDLLEGDGAGLTGERGVSFTAREQTEVLLIDVAHAQPPTDPTALVVAAGPAVHDAGPPNPDRPSPGPGAHPQGEAP